MPGGALISVVYAEMRPAAGRVTRHSSVPVGSGRSVWSTAGTTVDDDVGPSGTAMNPPPVGSLSPTSSSPPEVDSGRAAQPASVRNATTATHRRVLMAAACVDGVTRRMGPRVPGRAGISRYRPGTIPAAGPRTACGCSSVGRARPSQGRCREFESRHPLHPPRSRSQRDTLPIVDVASSSLVIRSTHPGRAPSATLCPSSMSRVRVSSSAPPTPVALPARHSAHRRGRCREFESRHPLHPPRSRSQRDALPIVDVASSSLVIRSVLDLPSAALRACPPTWPSGRGGCAGNRHETPHRTADLSPGLLSPGLVTGAARLPRPATVRRLDPPRIEVDSVTGVTAVNF